MIRYNGDLGCRYKGIPHDLVIIHDGKQKKVEACKICNKRFSWNKSYRGRIKNVDYLRAHVRNFAQRWGATKRIYYKIHKPEDCIIKI